MDRRLGRRLAGLTALLVALFVASMLWFDARGPSVPDAELVHDADAAPSPISLAGEDGSDLIARPEAVLHAAAARKGRRTKRRKLFALTVRVTDDKGEPVFGASVSVRDQPWTAWSDFERSPVGQRSTDRDGRTAFSLPRSGRYTLEATAEGFAVTRSGTYSTGDHVELRLVASRVLKGTVLDPEGKPLPGATVTVSQDRVPKTLMSPVIVHAKVETDGEGRFAVETPRAHVAVVASHPPHRASKSVFVSDKTHHEKPTITLRLVRNEGMKTRVIDEDTNEPVVGAEVRWGPGGPPSAVTDAEGRAELHGRISWEHGYLFTDALGYATAITPHHHAAEGVIHLTKGVEIQGKLLRENDDPWDVRVRVYQIHPLDRDAHIRVYDAPLYPKRDGTFTLNVLPEGYLSLRARVGNAYIVRTAEIPSSGGDVGIFDLTSGHAVQGEVVFPRDLERATIRLYPAMEHLRDIDPLVRRTLSRVGTVTRDTPGFRFPGLTEHGRYRVQVTAPGWHSVGTYVELTGHDTEPVKIEFPNLVHLRVRMTSYDGTPRQVHASIGRVRARSDDHGWVDFHVIPIVDGPPGTPPRETYHGRVDRDVVDGRSLDIPFRVRPGQKEPVLLPGPNDVLGRLTVVKKHHWHSAKPVTVEAWVNGKRVATTKTDPKDRHSFLFLNLPPNRWVQVRASLKVGKHTFVGWGYGQPGNRRISLPLQRKK